MHRFDLIEDVGAAFHEQIRQARGGTGIDQRSAFLLLEFLGVVKLLGPERMARQVGTQVHMMCPQPQRRPQNNLVKHRRRSVNDELAAFRRLHDSAQVSRVHFRYRDGALFA